MTNKFHSIMKFHHLNTQKETPHKHDLVSEEIHGHDLLNKNHRHFSRISFKSDGLS
jgi:hypothetical protein